LTYTFVEALKQTYPFYAVRLAGGALVFFGMFLMAYNVWKTITADDVSTAEQPVPTPSH
jgi:cytochrome c oxidase cbb3-type subunit 1